MPNADLKFCPRCASPLEWRGVEYPDVLHPVCTKCGFILWQNIKPCIDALIVRGEGAAMEVLLGRRSTEPAGGTWDLPGGFLNADDRIEPALIRECRREMGVEVTVGELVGAFEDVFLDMRIVELVYVCKIAAGEPRAADIIDDVRWFPVDAGPAFAFEYIGEAISAFRARLTR